MPRSARSSHVVVLLSLALAFASTLIGCSQKDSKNTDAQASSNHEGQGTEVTTDSPMVLAIKIDDQPVTIPLHRLSIYESKPNKEGKAAPQGYELEGDHMMLAGRLPEGLNVAPTQKFQQLVGQTIPIRPVGGEATFTKMSKITLSDDKVYRVERGTLKPTKAFYHAGKYAGVSGDVEVVLQQIKLGDTEDPNNKGDQPIGDPKTITGTFAAPAVTYPFEPM